MENTIKGDSPLQPSNKNPVDLTLWYRKPADAWVEALPVGNGHFGAMVFGGVFQERLQLNEDTLWSGYSRDSNVMDAGVRYLPELRRLIMREGDYYRAEELADKMQGPFTESYLPLVDLFLDMEHSGEESCYRRELDLDAGVVRVSYTLRGVSYRREVFASAADQVMVVRLSCDQPGGISFHGRLTSKLRCSTSGFARRYGLAGKAPRHVVPEYLERNNRRYDHPVDYDDDPVNGKGLSFECHMNIVSDGGVVRCDAEGFSVCGADTVSLLLWAGTDYPGFEMPGSRSEMCGFGRKRTPVDLQGRADAVLAAASLRLYPALLERHMADHRSLFRRLQLNLNGADNSAIPTDERKTRFEAGETDSAYMVQHFQFGRYMLIAGSRPGTQPLNLQGIWNDDLRPAWSGNYTLNINAQMVYWAVETANLSECHEPFLRFVEEMSRTGTVTAREYYQARGWVAHHNSDLWRATAPIGEGWSNSKWAMWPMGGCWCALHIWDHYLFTGDKKYLTEHGYPALKGSAMFALDFLIDDGKGHLTTCPSTYPESRFTLPDGRKFAVGAGTTFDFQILTALFTAAIGAAEELGIDADLSQQWADARDRLPPIPISEKGNMMYWPYPVKEDDGGDLTLHLLWALYPGDLYTLKKTPALMPVVQRMMADVKYGELAFPCAWIAGQWARLGEEESAYRNTRRMMGAASFPNLFSKASERYYQVDGLLGITAVVVEMLIQSHDDGIMLLPALPKDWANGNVKGLRARGGFEVDMVWQDGKLIQASVRSQLGKPARITCKPAIAVTSGGAVVSVTQIAPDTIEFPTIAGVEYALVPAVKNSACQMRNN